MKVNNLLKRIGSVVTTAAMLATLGTTGFAYNPTNGITDSGTDITINSVSVAPVTGATDVYKVTAGYTATKEQSVGVTMLTYAMAKREADKSVSDVNITKVSTDGKVTSGAGENMPIIGIDQNAKTVASGTGTFEFTFTTNSTNNSYYIAPGNTAIMFISGDNVSAKAAFSFNAPWTADTVDTVTFGTVNYTFGESNDSIKAKVQTELDKHTSVTVKNSTDNRLSTMATAAYSNIVPDTANNKATASVAYSNAMAPEAKLNITTPTSVEVTLNGEKAKFKATSAELGVGTSITIGVNDDKSAIEEKVTAAIKANGIKFKDGSNDTKTYTVNDSNYNSVVDKLEVSDDLTACTITLKNVPNTADTEYTLEENAKTIRVNLSKDRSKVVTSVTPSLKSSLTGKLAGATLSENTISNVGFDVTYGDIKNALEFAYTVAEGSLTPDGATFELYDVNGNKVNDTNNLTNGTDNTVKAVITLPNGWSFDTNTSNTISFTINVAAKPSVSINVTNGTGTETPGTFDISGTVANGTEVENAVSFKLMNGSEELPTSAYTIEEWNPVAGTKLTEAGQKSITAKVKLNSIADYDFGSGADTKTYTFNITVGAKPAEAVDAEKIEVAPATQPVGTSEANVINYLKTNVTKATAKAGGASAQVDIKPESWAVKTYNPNVIGDNAFTAKVVGGTYNNIKVNDDTEVTVTVKLSPIEKTGEIAQKSISVRPQTEEDPDNTKLFAAIGNQTINFGEGALADSYTITNLNGANATVNWTSGNLTTEGSTATVTYTFAADTKSKGELHTIKSGATVEFTVTVRNSVESNKAWELGNTGEYNAGTVKVYLPAGTTASETAPVEVVAKLYEKESATTELATAKATLTSDYNADTYNSVDLTFDNSFNAVDIHANDSYIVKVTVGGTPLTYKVGEGETAASKDFVQGTVYPTTSRRPSTGGGSTTPEVKSYNVSVKADNNGKATVNKSKATAGETVAVNVEPNEGYKVKEITVKDVNGKSIDVDQKTRTFEMPEGAVTVTVTFEEGTEEPTPDDKGKFKDVPDSFWAAADIYTLREAGIIDGKTADEFDPEGQVTRAEFTKMIVKMFGVEAKDTKVEFADCGEDDWFTPFVAAAVEAGYVKGYSDTEFAPDKVISREEACAILGRAYAKAANSELSFTDKDSIDEYAQPYVALLVEMGFINGYEDGTFRAQNHITRAEAAKIIGCAYRLATASK